MDAVVLVGGSGTRLRPLTLQTPKPMLPLVDRPLLAYLFDQLAAAGVTRAILACGYLPDALVAHFGDGGETASGIALEYVVESEPLGTAGAARLAASGRVSDTFLLLNGDILSEHDLAALVALHRARAASATLALVRVDDPSRYGVVELEPDGTVLRFVEKPAPGESREQPGERRRLRARAGGARLDPRRAVRSRSSARSSRRSSATASPPWRSTASGATSARPRATSPRMRRCSGTASEAGPARTASTTAR